MNLFKRKLYVMTINENHYHFHKEKVMAKINTTAWKIFEVCEPPNGIVLPQTIHRPLLEGPGSQGWSEQVSFFNVLCLGCPNSADSLTAPFSEHACRIRANESHWFAFPFSELKRAGLLLPLHFCYTSIVVYPPAGERSS